MGHGIKCHCMMCTMGKKIGMIKKEEESSICSGCGHAHGEDGKCECGCA